MGPCLLVDNRLHGGLAQQSRGVAFRELGPSPVVAPCLARAQRQTAHALGHSLAGQAPRLASRRWGASRSTVCTSTATSQQQQQALATAETKPPPPPQQADVVWSLFSYCAPPGTKTVELMGEWSSWLEPTPMSRKHVEADFTALLPLRPGMYQYKFVVDGVWTTAPQEPVVMVNKAGMYNNYRLVCASVKFESQAPAAILGSWDSFTTALDLAPQQQPPAAEDHLALGDGAAGGATRYKLLAQVPQGQHMYSVVVRGTDGGPMIVSTPQPVVSREERSYQLFVNGLPTPSRLVMRYRHWRGDAPLTQEFQEVSMLNAPVPFGSRASWKFAAVPTVPAPPAPPPLPSAYSGLPDSLNAALNDPLGQRLQGPGMPGPVSVPEASLEFYLTVADNEVSPARDVRPKEGGEATWRLRHASGFKLVLDSGVLRPYRRACKPRMLLCADIDGTMIGDPNCPGGFSSTERFTGTWEESNLPLGSVLAYNTGRSIGMVTEVLRMAGPSRMPTPDVVITAVGTKVFRQRGPLPGTYGYGFPGSGTTAGSAPGGATGNGAAAAEVQWEEDVEWTRSLDPGWDLDKVRQLVWDQVRRHEGGGGHQHHHNRHAGSNGANGGQQPVKVIDNGEEHRHRVALIAHHRVADAVRAAIAKGCSQAGLDVNLILSGAGEYRFIDCVPVNAGKEQALQYIRKLYNVPQELTVAAGDSGNDMLMLAGPHPAIVVGNAQAELLQWAVSEPLENDGLVYTTAHIADGVLEGLARLDLL